MIRSSKLCNTGSTVSWLIHSYILTKQVLDQRFLSLLLTFLSSDLLSFSEAVMIAING